MVRASGVIDGYYAFRLVVRSYVSISDIPFTNEAVGGCAPPYFELCCWLIGLSVDGKSTLEVGHPQAG